MYVPVSGQIAIFLLSFDSCSYVWQTFLIFKQSYRDSLFSLIKIVES